MILDLNDPQEFSPELPSRQTEYILWGAVGLFIGLSNFIPGYLDNLGFWSWALFIIFVFAVILISINNWNLRNTKLILSLINIEHISKLRQVSVRWESIERVQITAGRIGDKIIVNSTDGTFFFDTLGELKIKDVVKEKSGFEQGDKILNTILDKAGFTEKDKKQDSSLYYYYSRN